MKWMIASDLHGDAACTAALLERYAQSGAQRLVLLGDLLYHGPRNDLPSGYAPKQVIKLLCGVREHLICVRGNCDTEVDQMVLNFPMLSDTACLYDGKRTWIATHGHRHSPDAPPPLRKGDVLLCGHTHVPAFEHFTTPDLTRCLYINPGSVSLPKQDSPHSYILADGEVVRFCTLEGKVYREEFLK